MGGYLPKLQGNAESPNKRSFGRIVCQSVRCSLGEVVDLSAKGMKVRTRQNIPVGTIMTITIEGLDGPIALNCFAPWRRRIGLLKFEVGICFVDLKANAIVALNQLARCSAHNETMLQDIERFRRSA